MGHTPTMPLLALDDLTTTVCKLPDLARIECDYDLAHDVSDPGVHCTQHSHLRVANTVIL